MMEDWLIQETFSYRRSIAAAETEDDGTILSHQKEEEDEDGIVVWKLRRHAPLSTAAASTAAVTMQDLVQNMDFANAMSFFRTTKNDDDDDDSDDHTPQIIQTDDHCCLSIGTTNNDLPSRLSYHLVIRAVPTTTTAMSNNKDNNNNKDDSSNTTLDDATIQQDQQLQISSLDAKSASNTFSCVLHWISSSSSSSSASSSSSSVSWEVTIQAFATQPRQPLPPLQRIIVADSNNNNNQEEDGCDNDAAPTASSSSISCLRWQFVALDINHMNDWFRHCDIPHMEFIQCSTTTTTDASSGGLFWSTLLTTTPSTQQLQSIKVSCTLQEFAGLAPHLNEKCTLTKVHLVLHFTVQGPSLLDLCTALQHNTSIQHFIMEYLDLNDTGFKTLLQSLQGHVTLTTLSLGFTDNFVDNYRRLTPERRTERSQCILDLIQATPTVQNISWPKCQQDENLVPQIEMALNENRARKEQPRVPSVE